MTYQERLQELGLPSLEYRQLKADVIEVFKIINSIDTVNIEKFFTFAQYAGTRGHSHKLFKRRPCKCVLKQIYGTVYQNL